MLLRLPASPARPLLRKIMAAGLRAADPFHSVLRTVSRQGSFLHVGRRRYDLSRYDRVIVAGAGKASARMAQALERLLGPRLDGGLVAVKHGYGAPTKRIAVAEAGHPIPDRPGLTAGRRIRTIVGGLTPRDLLIVALSGGASSLLPAPVPGVSLADKRTTTRLLVRSGAAIQQINVVRKHLSLLKGGGLAASTRATIVTLVLSDVIGDDLGSIGSGPTAADPSRFADAIAVLRRQGIWDRVPESVRRHLQRGRRGDVPETVKPGARRLRHVQHEIIGNNRLMLAAAARAARGAGLHTLLSSRAVTGEAQEAARRWARRARRIANGKDRIRRPCCVIAGGETTVSVSGRGTGGRAQEFATAAALQIAGLSNVWAAALGTDGTDGTTDAAGAVVSGATAARAQRLGVDLARALQRHDTYPALRQLGCHIVTGPTRTNVNDLYLLLLL
jgi:glycerate 2-kinase